MSKKENAPKIARVIGPLPLIIRHTSETIQKGQICDLSHLTAAEWKILVAAGHIETAEGKPVNVSVARPAQQN